MNTLQYYCLLQSKHTAVVSHDASSWTHCNITIAYEVNTLQYNWWWGERITISLIADILHSLRMKWTQYNITDRVRGEHIATSLTRRHEHITISVVVYKVNTLQYQSIIVDFERQMKMYNIVILQLLCLCLS